MIAVAQTGSTTGGDFDDERSCREAIAAGDTGAWNKLGNLLARQPGRDEEAEAAYREAIAAGNTGAWNNLGRLLARRGDVAGARAAFEVAIPLEAKRRGVDDPSDFCVRGVARVATAIARRPGVMRATERLGRSIRAVGRLGSALRSTLQRARRDSS